MLVLLLAGFALASPQDQDLFQDELDLFPAPGGDEIWGGDHTNQYPNVVALAEFAAWGDLIFCTGTLIDSRWVLTAAHCLWSMDSALARGDLFVLSGSDITNNGYTDSIAFANIVLHPQYVDGDFAYDMALVELASPKNGVDLAILNDEPLDNDWIGAPMTFVGFGMTDFGMNDSGTKRETKIPVSSYDSEIMYSEHAASNICQGDSGGPVFETNDAGILELAGINSFIYTGCSGGGSGATRVDVFIDWISGHVPGVLVDGGDGYTTPGDDDDDPTTPKGDDDDDDYGDDDTFETPESSSGTCATGPLPGSVGSMAFLGLLAIATRRQAAH